MPPLINDGIYAINDNMGDGPGPTQCATLVDGNPFGPVVAYDNENPGKCGNWRVRNLGGNKITLESAAVPGTYASAYVLVEGISLIGSPNSTIWVVKPDPNVGQGVYNITTADGKYTWVCDFSLNYDPIFLKPAGKPYGPSGRYGQLRFDPVTGN